MGDLVSFGVEKLWDLLSQEYEQFQGVKDQIDELKTSLNTLKSFLEDANAKKHTSAMVRNCVEGIKEIVWDAEDIIETFVIKYNLGKESGIKKRIRRLACVIPERREIALGIEGISKRISKVISEMKSFGVNNIIMDGGFSAHSLHDRQREMRRTFSKDHEHNLVGLDENIKKLVGLVVEEEGVQVFSITGMGGIGKTTLARQVYNHEMVKNHFDGLAWVCVSQDFTRKSVWQAILRNLRPKEEEKQIMEMAELTLHDELFRLLETSKSLIVLDDIWKKKDWDLIKNIFPPKKGWKVLLTSRKRNIAVRGDTAHINFESECLGNKDSWTLLQKIAFPREDVSELVDEEMEKMAKKMIKHCGGLPLAVRVLGGLLAAKYTLHDWKRIYENIGSHLVGRTDLSDDSNHPINYVLSLSFEELPSYLKHCFLYLAHFPEDHEIRVNKLSYYWAAEGIFKPKYFDGESIEDVGSSYIEELVRRNMVIGKRDLSTLKFETCHLHDMMRDICLFKTKEENFLQIGGICSPTANSQSRRFVWQNPTTLNVEREINNPKLRSLMIISYFPYITRWMLSGLSFTRLQLLRVLDLPHADFEGGKLPYSIGKLIHLRYLSLEAAKVTHLPSSLRNLKLLIYLDISGSGNPIFVPNILMGMQELRYLALPIQLHKKTKLELSNLVNLETLLYFSPEKCSLEDLKGMTRLRYLMIFLTYESNVDTWFPSISGLKNLESLFIMGNNNIKVEDEKIVLASVHLKMLVLNISMPKLRHFPSHLTYLNLNGCNLEEDPMPILGKLRHLIELNLLDKSYSGTKLVCSRGGFPQLRLFKIRMLLELEEWIVEEGSMPLLGVLTIDMCGRLEQLHDGLRYIYSLKALNLYGMGYDWVERLSEGGKDYFSVQHIPSVNFKNMNDYK